MVGAALHHDVAALEVHFFLVQYQPHFTLGDDAVVEGFGAVHQLVPGVGFARASVGLANFGEHCRGTFSADLVLHAVRWNIHHPNHATQGAGAQLQGFAAGITGVVEQRRAGAAVPQFMKHRARYRRQREHVRRRPVAGDDGLAMFIVPGDHSFEFRKRLHGKSSFTFRRRWWCHRQQHSRGATGHRAEVRPGRTPPPTVAGHRQWPTHGVAQ
ncbi:hypothetical protein D3C73_1092490 [compost metagenome]